MFLLRDSDILQERYLVYVNDMLGSGDIPDLFTEEEKEAIIGSIMGKVKALGLPQDQKSCWNFFIEQVRKNLHIVVCMSPASEDFRKRCTRFPALVTCTVIDWFQPWPADALLSVAQRFLSLAEDLGTENVREAILRFMPFAFEAAGRAAKDFLAVEGRRVYNTNKTYLECLKLFNRLLKDRRSEVQEGINRLRNGLQQLKSASEEVARFETELEGLVKAAEEKKRTSVALAEAVAKEKETVEQETKVAEVEQENTSKIQADVEQRQKDCEEDLAKAEPLLQAAMEALNTLDKKALSECKTMVMPPAGVEDIFVAVMVLLAGVDNNVPLAPGGRVRPDARNWDAAKKALLTNVQAFLDTLHTYKDVVDEFGVPNTNWKEVREFLALEHFKPEVIASKNQMAAGLCAWVINIVKYHDTLEIVEPKRRALDEANARLEDATDKLAAARELVTRLQRQLEKLTFDLEAAEKERAEAEQSVNTAQLRLKLARRLIKALGDENVRWEKSADDLAVLKESVVGDTLLAAVFLSYAGPFSAAYREDLVKNRWLPFLRTGYDGEAVQLAAQPWPLDLMTTASETAKWEDEGLPSDRVSLENGLLVTRSERWPLLVDPQLQGVAWLKAHIPEGQGVFLRHSQTDLLIQVANAVENGQQVIIEVRQTSHSHCSTLPLTAAQFPMASTEHG